MLSIEASTFYGVEGTKEVYNSYITYSFSGSYSAPTFSSKSNSDVEKIKNILSTPKGNILNTYQGYDEIEVTNSAQLVYALTHGYLVDWATASNVYDVAQSIVKQICSDGMSEFDKIRAVYEWVVENVVYSFDSIYDAENISKYNDLGVNLEGALVDKYATDEGIAKAIAVLGNLAGITTIVITDAMGSWYWNKAFVNGNWYVIDAALGIQEISITPKSEIISYTYFLITDEDSLVGEPSIYSPYADEKYVAVNVINQYANIKNLNSSNKMIDSYIQNENELNEFMNMINEKISISSGESSVVFSFEFATDIGLITNLEDLLNDKIHYVADGTPLSLTIIHTLSFDQTYTTETSEKDLTIYSVVVRLSRK